MKNVYGLVVHKAGRNPLAGRFLLENEDLLPNESKIADIIGTALEELRAGAFGQSLMNALNAGNATNAIANLDWGKFGQTLSTMRLPLEQQLAASGKGEAKALGDVIGHMAFNVTDPRAVEWAATRAGEQVITFSQSVKDDIRGVITSAFVNQTDPREIAGMIDRQVGLFPRWATAVENRYQQSLTGFMASGMPYGDANDRAKALADAYRERLIDKRCQMIARTEVIRAANQGRATAWAQAVEAGLIDPATTTKEWVAEADACDECDTLNEEQVFMDDSFSTGDDMPPLHPNCRCSVVLVPDGQPTEKPAAEPLVEPTATPAMTAEDITPAVEGSTADEVRPQFDSLSEALDHYGLDTMSGWVDAVNSAGNVQERLAVIPEAMGNTSLPQVVDAVEFQRVIDSGAQQVYRGTYDGATLGNFNESFVSGEMFHGQGVYGTGTYFSTEQAIATNYGGGNPDNTFTAALRPEARTIDYRSLESQIKDFQGNLWDRANAAGKSGDTATADALMRLMGFMDEPGRAASVMGYDAHIATIEGKAPEIIVHNRASLVIRS